MNLKDVCRLLSRYGINLVYSRDEEYSTHKSSLIPSEYDRIMKDYFKERHVTIDMNQLLSMELKQTLVGQLYGKHYYSIHGKKLFEADEKTRDVFERVLNQRKDIEKYFRIDGFSEESRFYTYYRVKKLAESHSLKIEYNSGEFFNGSEWTSKLPTDSQIIMWMFCTWVKIAYREHNDLGAVVRVLYEYMDYHHRYSDGEDSLVIVQVTPPRYAPHYKIISGTEELDCMPGNNNVFNAILFFMYMIKTKKNGTFGANHNSLLSDIFR